MSDWASRWRRDGTANSGVPQRIILSDTRALPLAGFFQLANLALDHVALQHAQVSDEEDAVEVIDFVAKRARKQSFAAHFEFFARSVMRAYGHVLRPSNVRAKPRHGEASFFFALLPFGVNDFRIRADEFGLRILAVAHVDYGDAQAQADLRGSQAHTVRRIHGLEHVVDELLKIGVELLDALGRRFKHRVPVFNDWMNHLRCICPSCLLLTGDKTSEARLKVVELFLISVEIAASLLHRIPAEFVQERSGQFQRDHGFADHAGGGNYAHIRTLVSGFHRLFCFQIRRLQWTPQS